jgi:hypothetical protein
MVYGSDRYCTAVPRGFRAGDLCPLQRSGAVQLHGLPQLCYRNTRWPSIGYELPCQRTPSQVGPCGARQINSLATRVDCERGRCQSGLVRIGVYLHRFSRVGKRVDRLDGEV